MKARHAFLLALAMAIPATSPAQMTSEPGVVIEATPIRIDPTAAVPLATLPRGMDVTVLAVQDGWLQIAFEDLRYGRRVGYVPRSTVSVALPAAPPAVARVEAIPSAPKAVSAAPAAPAPAPPPARAVDKRATASAATKPVAPATVPSRTPAAATRRPVRPPVQLVEADFPDLASLPRTKTGGQASAAAPATAATASTVTAARPAARPPVRLVEAEFPDLVTPPKKKAQTGAAPREIVSIGDAFPDAAGSPVSPLTPSSPGVASAGVPSLSAQPAAGKPAARPPVRLVHSEFPAIAGASSTATPDGENASPRAVVSIGDAFPAVRDASAAPDRDAVSSVALHTVDNRNYVSVDMGLDAGVFDARSAGVETIVARVLKQGLLSRIREYAKGLPPVAGAHGIYVRYRIPHHAAPQTKEYQLELVADMPHVVAFALAATTDEAFVDGSTLRVDGSTIRVDLAGID